jgi:hypothetical protein
MSAHLVVNISQTFFSAPSCVARFMALKYISASVLRAERVSGGMFIHFLGKCVYDMTPYMVHANMC